MTDEKLKEELDFQIKCMEVMAKIAMKKYEDACVSIEIITDDKQSKSRRKKRRTEFLDMFSAAYFTKGWLQGLKQAKELTEE